jgi:hypothetical protein
MVGLVFCVSIGEAGRLDTKKVKTVSHRSTEGQKRIIVSPCLDVPIPDNTNVVWCGTLQLAWNALCDLTGGPVQLDAPSDTVIRLNRKQVQTNDFDARSYFVVAGTGPKALGDIKRQLRMHKADSSDFNMLPRILGKKELIVYAHLSQQLPFTYAFTRLKRPHTFAGRQVASFGIVQFSPEDQEDELRMARQVLLYDYRNENDFIVKLIPKNKDHRIILTHVPRSGTMAEMIQLVNKRMSENKPTRLKESADLTIPVIDFDIIKTYSDLQGRIVSKNSTYNGSEIKGALQTINFRLDEKGAVLKSIAVMYECDEQSAVFKNPFLVILYKAGAEQPYFAAWIANAELLEPYRKIPVKKWNKTIHIP